MFCSQRLLSVNLNGLWCIESFSGNIFDHYWYNIDHFDSLESSFQSIRLNTVSNAAVRGDSDYDGCCANVGLWHLRLFNISYKFA